MAPTIRRLVDADAPDYKRLRDATLARFPTAFTSDAAEEATRSAEAYHARFGTEPSAPGGFTLGAWRAERLVGALTCSRDRRTKARHVAELTGMMVDVESQGLGLGAALLDVCLETLRRDPTVTLVDLSVTAGNGPAIRLYERFGFVRWGTLDRAIRVDGVYHAKDRMALSL